MLGKYSNISSLLPSPDELKNIARDAVASDAKVIEDLISQTAEWDKIDSLLTQFKKATILDKFTSNEASSRLRPLIQMREQKEAQVDDLLDDLIRDQDFQGIKEFIMPLADSKDQIKRQKFNQWCNKIASSLSTTVSEINRDLERAVSEEMCHSIINQLKVLEHARKELSPRLVKLPGGLNIGKELQSVKTKIREILEALVEIFSTHYSKMNFEGMGVSHRSVVLLSSQMEVHLTSLNKRSVKDLRKQFDRAVNSVTMLLDRFVQSGFQEDAKLHQIFPSLQKASES
eukprot:15224475-Ditylum_brightwellii.AAC.1